MLPSDRIDVWRIAVCDTPDSGVDPGILSVDERLRASRFVSASARHAFSFVHVALRCILAEYVEVAPAALRFEYGRWGKPSLSGTASHIHFSVSHSSDAAVVAVSLKRLGVDIERIRPVTDDVVEQSLTREEISRVKVAKDPLVSFLEHWTLKEAYLKACGIGLNTSLQSLRVVPGEGSRIEPFHLANFCIWDGFAAAVAVELEPAASPPGLLVRDWDWRRRRFAEASQMWEADRVGLICG